MVVSLRCKRGVEVQKVLVDRLVGGVSSNLEWRVTVSEWLIVEVNRGWEHTIYDPLLKLTFDAGNQ